MYWSVFYPPIVEYPSTFSCFFLNFFCVHVLFVWMDFECVPHVISPAKKMYVMYPVCVFLSIQIQLILYLSLIYLKKKHLPPHTRTISVCPSQCRCAILLLLLCRATPNPTFGESIVFPITFCVLCCACVFILKYIYIEWKWIDQKNEINDCSQIYIVPVSHLKKSFFFPVCPNIKHLAKIVKDERMGWVWVVGGCELKCGFIVETKSIDTQNFFFISRFFFTFSGWFNLFPQSSN